MYYVYLIQCEDGSIYTGIANDLKRRFREHAERVGGRYTRAHTVEKIVYFEEHATRGLALKREAQIKGWRRERKMALIQSDKKL